MANNQYRPDVDGLRAIAIISVLLFHFYPENFSSGFLGVDIFFTISGFLISKNILSSLNEGSFNFFNFYSRRIKRILPSIFFVFIFCIIIVYYFYDIFEILNLSKHIFAGVFFSSNFLLLKQTDYFSDNSLILPLLHLWSLSIEEQLYIVLPFILYILYNFRKRILLYVLFLWAVSFIYNIYLTSIYPSKAFYLPFSRAWEILSGVLVYFLINKFDGNNFFLKNLLSFLGLFILSLGFFVFDKKLNFPGFYALLPVLGTSLIILSGPESFLNKKIISNKILVFLGLISFSLYVWHWPLVVFSHKIFGNLHQDLRIFIVIIITFLISLISYWAIEKPFRYGFVKARWIIIPWFFLGFFMFFIFSGNLWIDKSAVFGKVINYKYDYQKDYQEGLCFLKPEQKYRDFSNCIEEIDFSKPSIMIWGDSHAAHLYAGYKEKYKNKYNIIHRSASGCPPILGYLVEDRPNCFEINKFIYQEFIRVKPDRLVLAAAWNRYDIKNFFQTLDELNKEYYKYKVDIIGPVPQWTESLPRQIIAYHQENPNLEIPKYMNFGLDLSVYKYDEEMRSIVDNYKKFRYLSPLKLMCNISGCPTFIEWPSFDLTAWDYGHLTKAGSQMLLEKFPE